MTLSVRLSAKTARLTALRDDIDAGSGTAQLILYDGPRPTAGGQATNALVVVDLPVPCGTIQGNILTLGLPDSTNAVGDGDITWARITGRDGNWVIDMDAGDDPTTADLYISPATVSTGGIIDFLDKRIAE